MNDLRYTIILDGILGFIGFAGFLFAVFMAGVVFEKTFGEKDPPEHEFDFEKQDKTNTP